MAESVPSSKLQQRRKNTPPDMSSSSGPLAEELRCSLCLDVFTDPVSTPCGHNFCKSCLNQHWDINQDHKCPTCNETFSNRPNFKINTALRQVVQLFKEKFSLSKSEVLCDICDEIKVNALKSCLVCQTSYCQTHLEPHQRVPNLKKHKLIDPVDNIEDFISQKRERPLELFCKDDQRYICVVCSDGDHNKTHDTEEAQLMKTKKDVQQMIQDRIKKIEDNKHSAELREKQRTQTLAETYELTSALVRFIEIQKATEKQDEDLIQELQQEITELKMRNTELDHLSHTEDQLHLLQSYSPPCIRNWPEISMNTGVTVKNVRRALTKLQQTLDRNVCQMLRRMQQYAVDVTLDPETAHPELILSDDGKQVRARAFNGYLPDNPERYDSNTSVLGKEGFSSGRFYFEVQVEGKTHWTVGVVRESVNRKGYTGRNPSAGFWLVDFNDDIKYSARNDPFVILSLRVRPDKVGVFVDYEEGLVSFYDVESRSHIYSFTAQTFTERLYPFLDPWDQDKTSATMVISPVS